MITIDVTTETGDAISVRQDGNSFLIRIDGEEGLTRSSATLTFEEIRAFAQELAGAVALWNVIRMNELVEFKSPSEAS